MGNSDGRPFITSNPDGPGVFPRTHIHVPCEQLQPGELGVFLRAHIPVPCEGAPVERRPGTKRRTEFFVAGNCIVQWAGRPNWRCVHKGQGGSKDPGFQACVDSCHLSAVRSEVTALAPADATDPLASEAPQIVSHLGDAVQPNTH
jgi:hypothetical protein